MREQNVSSSRLARADSRPLLVSILVAGWLVLSALGGLRALVVLGNAAATSWFGTSDPMARAAAEAPDLVTDEMREALARRERRLSLDRALSGPVLFVAALGVVGAIRLARRRRWSRALLVTAGLLALGLLAFHAFRSLEIMTAAAAGLPPTDPDVPNALSLTRAVVGINLALQALPLILAMSLLRHPVVRGYLAVPGERRAPPETRRRGVLIAMASAILLAAGAVFFSKSRPEAPPPARSVPDAASPEPAETFRWSAQAVSLSPPPKSWTRERHAEGGRKGVRFTRYAVPPSRIIVAEAPVSPAPRTVDEALSTFRLTAASFRSADQVLVGEPVPAVVAGLPAFQTDFTLRDRSMPLRGREFLTVVDGHVFVFSLLGPEADLRVLENLVASVRFPASGPDGDRVRTVIEEASPGAPAAGDVAALRVGEHRITIRIPPPWERVDYGERQEFRHREAKIVLADGGALQGVAWGTEIHDERVLDRALRDFGHDPRRWEIAAKTWLRSGPHEALAVDTWDPLTHVVHARTILFANGGRLLVLGTAQGSFELTHGPLDEMARSIRFLD